MLRTVANLKDNLNKIALNVHHDADDDADFPMYCSSADGENNAVSNRRDSHSFAHSKSPVANGISDLPYASEDQITRLNKENGSLKQHMEASAASTNGTYTVKGSSDHSSNQQLRFTTQMKSHYTLNNGTLSVLESDATQSNMELADMTEGKKSPTAAVPHTAELQNLKLELEQERHKFANIQLKVQEEQRLKESFQEELKLSRLERDKTAKEMSKLQNELNEKVSEIKQLRLELTRGEDEEAGDVVESLKRIIKTLEKENTTLKIDKKELEAALITSSMSFICKMSSDASQIQNKDPSSNSDLSDPSKSFPGKEDMERSLQQLSEDLRETQKERDKAVQELTRLKQHLLEKESEESEKMDEDIKIIEELRNSNYNLRAQISHLEGTLKQATASQEKLKMAYNNEILKSRETINDLNMKLTTCMSTIDAKNMELLNLQRALGQYFAEIEAKERVEGELAHAKEETAKLSHLLKDADYKADALRGEREEILGKLSQSEKLESEWRSRVSKLEEENAKMRRALEQSMTRLNRMSVDSDFLVDRRIVIKLLITYFQRNHSKEVLDLMVRMLGFSDEDKQRIGSAQQGPGKGVVRGVLGLVGGILGGISTESAANMGSDNQSFADLWVDFLLKETEEREKRELQGTSHDIRPNTISAPPTPPLSTRRFPSLASINSPTHPNVNPLPRGYFQPSEQIGSEFSTVPLTPSVSKTPSSELHPQY